MTSARLSTITRGLEAWRGDLSWVHRQEGHYGKGAYWPGGASGVTLDPGVDLGYVDWMLFETAYRTLLTAEQQAACRAARGLRGRAAQSRVRRDPVLRTIRLRRDQTDEVFAHVAVPYWRGVARRFPRLVDPTTPSPVQTALLSLAFNRGPHNADLAGLADNVARGDWRGLAREIAAMQQSHELRGIRERRRAEARLILSGVPADDDVHEAQLEAAALATDNGLVAAAALVDTYVSQHVAGLTPLIPLPPQTA